MEIRIIFFLLSSSLRRAVADVINKARTKEERDAFSANNSLDKVKVELSEKQIATPLQSGVSRARIWSYFKNDRDSL